MHEYSGGRNDGPGWQRVWLCNAVPFFTVIVASSPLWVAVLVLIWALRRMP